MINILMAGYQGTFFPGANTRKNPRLNCFSGWSCHCTFVRCAGGCPGSGEEEVSLELTEVLLYRWEGKQLLA